MATTAARPSTLPIPELAESRRAELISALNASLASMTDLALCAKQAHWNVKGPDFHGLHELFDTIAEETRGWSDLLAERAVTLGGNAHGTVQDVAQGTNLSPFPTDERKWQVLSRELLARMLAAGGRVRELASGAEDEIVTQDLAIEIARGLEMRAWMVRAHVELES